MKNIKAVDTVNPKTDKTYRQENREKAHNIPLGAIVELRKYKATQDAYVEDPLGLRLYVVLHSRAMDQTPLYYLSCLPYEEWEEERKFAETCVVYNRNDPGVKFGGYVLGPTSIGGYTEESLKVVSLQPPKD